MIIFCPDIEWHKLYVTGCHLCIAISKTPKEYFIIVIIVTFLILKFFTMFLLNKHRDQKNWEEFASTAKIFADKLWEKLTLQVIKRKHHHIIRIWKLLKHDLIVTYKIEQSNKFLKNLGIFAVPI